MPEKRPSRPSRGSDRAGSARLARLAHLQTSRPLTLLLVALATVILAGVAASRLKLKTSFGELLPQNKESVAVAHRVSERLVSTSTLTVTAQGSDNEALKRFVDALSPELRKLDPALVGNIDDGVRESRAFFARNLALYASLEDVQRVHDRIRERYEWEVARRTGALLDEDEPPPAITREALGGEAKKREEAAAESFPDGYYLDPETGLIAVMIRTSVTGGDLERSAELQRRVEEVIAEVDPKRFDPAMRVQLTGDLITSAEEYAQVKGDLSHVGAVGVAMVLAAVFLFFLRIRALVAMTLSVGIGVAWTFGLAWLLIGHLNSSTGFLVSIVVGNGINFGILYMARYLEARRTEDLLESVLVAHSETWKGTFGAAAASMVAYGSLVVTDLRGFKHFGIIGATGMMLCWLGTYLFLPSMLTVAERWRPLGDSHPITTRLRGMYGLPFAFAALRAPRAVAFLGTLTGIAAIVVSYRYIAADPMEYDMRNTRNEPKIVETSARELGRRVDTIVGRQGQDGLAIMVDRVDQVLPLKQALDARRDAAPEGRKPFDKVVTIYDLLPTDQEKKIELARASRELLMRARGKGFISDADWVDIEKVLPPEEMRAIGIADLPEQVGRAFTEKDGTRGRLVYIVPATGRSVWDAHYLIEWADSFRETPLPDGSVIKGSGRSVIFADLILAVLEDTPIAIGFSLASTILIIVLTFRRPRRIIPVILTLLLGLAWMVAVLAVWNSKIVSSPGGLPSVELAGMKLNFLNFVALPITIGVGADYAINVMQRYDLAGPAELRRMIVETGGAIILCSMTTILGYLALTSSINQAIQSFGIAGAAGEIGCLLAAVLVLPAWLEWRRRAKQPPPRAPSPDDPKPAP